MQVFTVFCREKSGRGTTWVDVIEARDVADAKERGIAKCSFDWNYDPLEIYVIGVLAGEAVVLEWEDFDNDLSWEDYESNQ